MKMCHYVGFLQIRSHIPNAVKTASLPAEHLPKIKSVKVRRSSIVFPFPFSLCGCHQNNVQQIQPGIAVQNRNVK